MNNLNKYISEKLQIGSKTNINSNCSDKSKQYWKDELGFDPSLVDYSVNQKAQNIIDKFEQANKLCELYDYLISGITSKMSKSKWIDYVADTDIEDYETYNGKLNESAESEDLHEEIGLALREFGSIRNGFKMAKLDDIKDAMYKLGFDFVEEDSSDDKLVFIGEYIDTKYEVTLFADDRVSGKFKIKNFNEIIL